MPTARNRLNFLRERVAGLMGEIDGTEVEADVAKLAKRLSAGRDLPRTPDDAEWDLLLQTERRQQLPAYYLRLRTELATLEGEAAKARTKGELPSWLDGPVPQLVGLASGLIAIGDAVVEHGVEVLHALGLAYSETGLDGVDADTLD